MDQKQNYIFFNFIVIRLHFLISILPVKLVILIVLIPLVFLFF